MVQDPRARRESVCSTSSTSTRAHEHAQFRILKDSELPDGTQAGVDFQTVSVCPSYYLPWITKELASRGVEVVRKKVASYGEAAALAGANGVLINATGLGASSGLHSTDCL